MSTNEIKLNGVTIMSVREDSVSEKNLLLNETATNSAGEKIKGELDPVTEEELDEVKEQLNELSDDVYKVSDEEGEIEETDYIPFNDISDVEKPKKKALLSSIIDKIKSAFLPKTWGHVELIQNSETLRIKDTQIDATESDNGVTAIHYPSSNDIVDNNSRILSRYEAVVKPNGDIYAKMYARNYDANGNTVGSNSIEAGVDKSGNNFYFVTDPDKFRKAINTIDQMGTRIPANSDLDDYVTAGTYYVENNSDAGTISNMPFGVAYSGKLIVLDMDSNVRVDQIYITNFQTNSLCYMYIRQIGNDGVARPWREITAPHTYELGTEIPINSDFNNYKTAGVYYVQLDSTASDISNMPISKAGKLVVSKTTSANNYLLQTFYANATTNVYERYYNPNGDSWSSWKQLASVSDFQNYTHWLYGQTDSSHKILYTDDLDDFTNAGTYQYNYNASGLPLNCPFTTLQSFKLIVDKYNINDTKSEVMQKITMRNNAEAVEYIRVRTYNTSTWGSWKKYATTDDITPANVGNGYAEATVSGSTITATITGFKLRAGVIVAIRIVPEITSACTLNINNTGAKSVKFWSNEDVSFGKPIGGARITTFIYDGTYYRVISIDRTPYVGQQSYVADTSGNILIDWGYGSNRAQLKHNIGSNKLLWNYYKNSVWRGDVVLADYDDLITWGQKDIPTGSDLNDYNTIGVYSIKTGTIAQNTDNIPIELSGKLIVVALTSTSSSQSWKAQFYIPNHEEHFYQRVKTDNDGWRPWVEYANTNQIIKTGSNLENIASLDDIPVNTVGKIEFTSDSGLSPLESSSIRAFFYTCFTPTSDCKVLTLTRYNPTFTNSSSKWERVNNGSGWTPYWVDYTPRGTYVGTCTTAGGTKDKVATVEDSFKLTKGVRVAIKFSNTNTYSNATANPITLNVNGTGAKNIWYNTTHSGAGNTGTYTTPYGVAGRYNFYIYDGTYWVWDSKGNDDNSTNFLRNDASSTLVASGGAFLDVKSSSIDITQANNGVSETLYPAYIIQDKNGKDMTRLETVVETNGQIRTFLQVCNYNTSTGTHFRNGITMFTNKSQDMWYGIANPHNFQRELGFGYGTCDTAGSEQIKVVTMPRFRLTVGGMIAVKFTNTNTFNSQTATPVQLNVNGTGAKNIWYNTTHSGAGNTGTNTRIYGEAGRIFTYVYDGTYWVWVNCGYEADTVDPRVIGIGYGTCTTAEATTAKVVTLSSYSLRTGGYVSVKFTNAVPANSTMNINSRGAKNIWYRGANITANIIKSNDLATFIYDGTRYHLIGIDRDSIDKRDCISMSDLVFGSTVTFVNTSSNYTVRGDISSNILHFNMEINFSANGTIPMYSDSTGGFFIIKGYSMFAWTMVHVEYNGNYVPAYCGSGTYNGTQGICVRLRKALAVTAGTPLKLCFDGVLNVT